MPTLIKVWEVKGKKLISVEEASLADSHHESELEDWISSDPAILGEDLLVIARQLDISQVGRLDLLCINSKGKLVLVELKRDLSPREAVAQALDYASWVDGCSQDRILEIAKGHLKRDLEDAFREHFQEELPDWAADSPGIVIVAARLDASAERIVNFLAQRQGLDINAVFFKYSKLSDGKEILVRSVLVPEEVLAVRGRSSRRPSREALLAMASERQTTEQVETCRGIGNYWNEEMSNAAGGSFRYWAHKNNKWKMVFGVNVSGELAGAQPGELAVWVRTEGLAELAGMPQETICKKFEEHFKPTRSGAMDFVLCLRTVREAEELLNILTSFATRIGERRRQVE